jgi:hypothetical protein
MEAIKDPRQRADLAEVMAELSQFCTLISHPTVLQLELDAALDAVMQPRAEPLLPVPLLGQGVGHAFGHTSRLIVEHVDGTLSMDEIRSSFKDGPEAFDDMLSTTELEFERRMLAGPADEDLPRLRQLGYNPEAARGHVEARAEQEHRLKENLTADPGWRKGRLRDVVSARYLANELGRMCAENLQSRGVKAEGFLQSREAARRLVDSMPSGDVFVTLTTESHRNPQLTWQRNDVFDIDAMAVAVAYCDVVVTERHRQHQIQSTGLDLRLTTSVLASPAELANALSGTP